ncbi:beta/alpha barrel domain-containing protein [Lignipirellula cremea]|uniref:Dihydroorotate dehydrogenase 2 n=1 Tax=Lignipirellula cremea TaxID=2528010 RepID=A0A518E480_9BACT|nr:dihydroorotate dehydrogenase-like protein [Lignipirellula cremea]QDU98877.1 dihydroorotate dehydrogenase 2 [Lignipirellula cremea]
MSIDLTTSYLGIPLRSPLVASASPLTGNLDHLRRLDDCGVGAAVLPSLFEEQITHDEQELNNIYTHYADASAESMNYFPEIEGYNTGPEDYLRRIEQAKKACSMPIICSLNGATLRGWIRYAQRMEAAGVDALELNVYWVPVSTAMTAAEVEDRYCELVAAVKHQIRIPLSVKIGSQFSSLPIRWIAILRDQLAVSLAASSGIHTAAEVIKTLLAGADVAMMTAALLQHGPQYATQVLQELTNWLQENEYQSVRQLQGSMSRSNCADPGALERANYMKALINFSNK